MDFIEPCFGIGHNLSLICQMTSEDIKQQLITSLIAIIHTRARTAANRDTPSTDACVVWLVMVSIAVVRRPSNVRARTHTHTYTYTQTQIHTHNEHTRACTLQPATLLLPSIVRWVNDAGAVPDKLLTSTPHHAFICFFVYGDGVGKGGWVNGALLPDVHLNPKHADVSRCLTTSPPAPSCARDLLCRTILYY